MERAQHKNRRPFAPRRGLPLALATLASGALVACAPSAGSTGSAALEPGLAAPRESASIVFAGAWQHEVGADQAAALATRNDANLSPGPAHRGLSTTSWPNTGTRPELRRVPVIYSRWGRSF